jgi:hypothetical protein
MTFETFNRSVALVREWRSRSHKTFSEWPDSRDPEFRDIMLEFKVTPQDLEKSFIALAAWRHDIEGVYQLLSAITKVVVNRQNKGMFRTHLVDKDQFPFMADVDSPEVDCYPIAGDENFSKLLENVDDILQGKVVDLTQGAIWFGVVGDTMPDWFRTVITTNTRTVKIGNMVFYK